MHISLNRMTVTFPGWERLNAWKSFPPSRSKKLGPGWSSANPVDSLGKIHDDFSVHHESFLPCTTGPCPAGAGHNGCVNSCDSIHPPPQRSLASYPWPEESPDFCQRSAVFMKYISSVSICWCRQYNSGSISTKNISKVLGPPPSEEARVHYPNVCVVPHPHSQSVQQR